MNFEWAVLPSAVSHFLSCFRVASVTEPPVSSAEEECNGAAEYAFPVDVLSLMTFLANV